MAEASDGPQLPSFVETGRPTRAGESLRTWHASLTGSTGWKRDGRGRAALRRAAGLDDLLLDAAVPLERLRRRLVGEARLSDNEMERLAWVAASVAEIDGDAPDQSLGATFGQSSGGKPVVSIDRMTLLLATEEVPMFVRLLRGLLPLVQRQASVLGTGELVRRWASPASRVAARRRLMRDYIEAIPDNALQKAT
jgi:CRISPR type I-E-associated protein CasB/Cse2